MSTKHPRHPPLFRSLCPTSVVIRAPDRPWGRAFEAFLALFALSAFFTLASAACARSPERVPEDEDRARLGALLAADAKVDGFLSEADRLDRQGKGEGAAALVEGEATRALSDARALLGRTSPETAWGKERRAELDKLFTDRAAAMPTYAAALRGAGVEAKVEALTSQAALEKRALAIAASLKKADRTP